MKRALIALSLMAFGMVLSTVQGIAGDHFHFHGPPVGFYGPVVYPAPVVYAAPVAYPAPVVTYQPAYVVPAAVAVAPAYAPVVPQYPTVGYYYAPRPAYVVPVGYRRGLFGGLRPRDVEIELDYRRDGGYRYEIDFD